MSKFSIIIPARDERFLTPTIDDIFRNARGEIEVIAVLDSDKWPLDWKDVTTRHPRLHTIHNGSPKGMRYSINVGVASAVSRGATYIAKSDGHCSFSEGFDEVLKATMEPNWVVVPRRGRLDPENWTATETHKPDIDYHYLSYPDNPEDFGGPGLNGKPWAERAIQRKDILVDEECSSQGSFWFMEAAYFNKLELMDAANYSEFWSEFQEIGLKAWLSGGKVMVNKNCKYLHLHKGRKYGRGYKLQESWLQQGASFTKNWIWNEAWDRQTLPFEWLIDHFAPVPTWPENWRDVLYANRRPRNVVHVGSGTGNAPNNVPDEKLSVLTEKQHGQGVQADDYVAMGGLEIIAATYGVGEDFLDVTERVRALVKDNSLDIVVNNSTLVPNQNPYRGKKKSLVVVYAYDDGAHVRVERAEKEALIIGGPLRSASVSETLAQGRELANLFDEGVELGRREVVARYVGDGNDEGQVVPLSEPLGANHNVIVRRTKMAAPALNDFLLRRFNISPYRLRAPMPIELPNFHRNDLAQLFAELGFNKGAEIGVAEGNYSEVLLQANPTCELLLVDPWHAYSNNPQNKSKEKNEYALRETQRKVSGYKNVSIIPARSMDVIHDPEFRDMASSLDFIYIDGHHSFDFVMQDLIGWSQRVRSGGIVSGDDLIKLDEARWGAGPIEAVQAYVNAHRIPIWWLCAGHRSVDFFWVKP